MYGDAGDKYRRRTGVFTSRWWRQKSDYKRGGQVHSDDAGSSRSSTTYHYNSSSRTVYVLFFHHYYYSFPFLLLPGTSWCCCCCALCYNITRAPVNGHLHTCPARAKRARATGELLSRVMLRGGRETTTSTEWRDGRAERYEHNMCGAGVKTSSVYTA